MYNKLKYEDFVKTGTIRNLPEIERDDYVKFYEDLWKEDYEICRDLVEKSPRWSIISGYYAMHNLAKLFLAKNFRLKINGKFIHAAVIEALRKCLNNEDILKKLEKGKQECNLEEIPNTIEFAKREIAKSQYYSRAGTKANSNKTIYFLKNIVRPFIETLKKYV